MDLTKAFYQLGFFSQKPVTIGGKKIIPLDFFLKIAPKTPTPEKMLNLIKNGIVQNAVFALAAEVIGIKNGRKIRLRKNAVFPDLKKISKHFPGATYISYPTGLTAYIFSKYIPKIIENGNYGVFPPEGLNAKIRKEVLAELKNNGIAVKSF